LVDKNVSSAAIWCDQPASLGQVEMLHGAECHVFVFLTMICAMHAAWLAGMSRKSFGEKFRPGIAPGRPLQSWLLIPIPGYVVSPR
jgi:hypothetical protein